MGRENVKWEDGENVHVLVFTPYYDEEEIAHLSKDKDGDWILQSELLGKDHEYLDDGESISLEEAKEMIETMVEEHYQDEINYYKELFERFCEKSTMQ